MVWLPRPIGGIAHRAPPPARHDAGRHDDATCKSALGTSGNRYGMTIPRIPSHPLPSRLLRSPVSPTASWPRWAWHTNPLPTLLSWLSTGKKAQEGPGHTHRTHVLHTYERSRPDQRNLTMAPPVAWHCLEPSEWTIARRSSMLRPHAHPSLYSASPLGVLGM
jgi:hypothetical protein